ncbi:YdgA family protein [Delftia lacustris]|uniref:YdgA family protein n=1 Tax=Delftia lacustris TaxID=558537 RepID=UPI001EEFDAAA|nr:YdgA family protein [Delftia lacustris]
MNLTKILAGLLVGLAIVLAGLAWMLGSQPARPVAAPSPRPRRSRPPNRPSCTPSWSWPRPLPQASASAATM